MRKMIFTKVSTLNTVVSKNKAVFSMELCDICGTPGIEIEGTLYEGIYDYRDSQIHGVTYKTYNLIPYYKESYNDYRYSYPAYIHGKVVHKSMHLYVYFYFCSQNCADFASIKYLTG